MLSDVIDLQSSFFPGISSPLHREFIIVTLSTHHRLPRQVRLPPRTRFPQLSRDWMGQHHHHRDRRNRPFLFLHSLRPPLPPTSRSSAFSTPFLSDYSSFEGCELRIWLQFRLI